MENTTLSSLTLEIATILRSGMFGEFQCVDARIDGFIRTIAFDTFDDVEIRIVMNCAYAEVFVGKNSLGNAIDIRIVNESEFYMWLGMEIQRALDLSENIAKFKSYLMED
mgnify:CR=1 FL=1